MMYSTKKMNRASPRRGELYHTIKNNNITMKKSILVFSMTSLLLISGMNRANAQEQPKPKKDTVNMDTDAKPTFYYAAEEEKSKSKESSGKGGSTTIAIIAGAVVLAAGAGFYLIKKKK